MRPGEKCKLIRKLFNYQIPRNPPWRKLEVCVDFMIHFSRGILIGVFIFFHLGHTSKLFLFVHWFQNCFRFRSRTFPSPGGNFFGTLVDLEGEKRQQNAKFHNWLKTHPKVLNA